MKISRLLLLVECGVWVAAAVGVWAIVAVDEDEASRPEGGELSM